MNKRYIDFAALKAAVSISQVLEYYGVLPTLTSRGRGDALIGPCPIHQGKAGSDHFKVSISGQCWNCFGKCQQGGNVLDLVMAMEQVSLLEAAHLLNDWFTLNLVAETKTPRKTAAKPTRTKAVVPPEPAMEPSPEEEEESGENKPLGFELQNLVTDHPYMTERGLTPEIIAEFGLGYCANGRMAGRVVIPIHSLAGLLVGYVGRWPGEPDGDRPKYKLPNGFKKSAEVFHLHRALAYDAEAPLVVVEGYFDVIKLWQLGCRNAVALMGCCLSARQEELIAQAKRRLILLFDEDPAGQAGRDKALLRLAKRCFTRVATLPRASMQPEHLTFEELQTVLGGAS